MFLIYTHRRIRSQRTVASTANRRTSGRWGYNFGLSWTYQGIPGVAGKRSRSHGGGVVVGPIYQI